MVVYVLSRRVTTVTRSSSRTSRLSRGQLAPNVAVQRLKDSTMLSDGRLLVGHATSQSDTVSDKTDLVDGKFLMGHAMNQFDSISDDTSLKGGALLFGHTLIQDESIGDDTILVGGLFTMANGEPITATVR